MPHEGRDEASGQGYEDCVAAVGEPLLVDQRAVVGLEDGILQLLLDPSRPRSEVANEKAQVSKGVVFLRQAAPSPTLYDAYRLQLLVHLVHLDFPVSSAVELKLPRELNGREDGNISFTAHSCGRPPKQGIEGMSDLYEEEDKVYRRRTKLSVSASSPRDPLDQTRSSTC